MSTDAKVWVLLAVVFVFCLIVLVLLYAVWRATTRLDYMKARVDIMQRAIDSNRKAAKANTDAISLINSNGKRERIVRGDN